jgi:hypothetical protein
MAALLMDPRGDLSFPASLSRHLRRDDNTQTTIEEGTPVPTRRHYDSGYYTYGVARRMKPFVKDEGAIPSKKWSLERLKERIPRAAVFCT